MVSAARVRNEAVQWQGFDDEKAETECWNGCERKRNKEREIVGVDCLIVDEIFD